MSKLLKKVFTASVVALTIMWSMGLAALVPTVVNAAETCPNLVAGDAYKAGTAAAVWVLDSSMNKVYFPNEDVYKTWYAKADGSSDWAAKKNVAASCDVYEQTKNVVKGINYFPGSVVFKLSTIATKYYVTEAGNKKTEISEAAAAELFGADWKKGVKTYSEYFSTWSNTDGVKMDTARLGEGWLVKKSGDTVVYQVTNGKLVKVDGTLSGAPARSVRTVSATLFDAMEKETTTVTPASLTSNPVQRTSETTNDDTEVKSGTLAVTLSASTPASKDVPKNAQGLTYLTLNAVAGGESVDVTGLTIKRKGLGSSDDFDKIYVEVDGVRHGSKRVLGSDNEVEIYFSTQSSKITVPANGSVKIDVVADMSATSGNDNYLQVTAVKSDANLNASLPISGNSMHVSNVESPSIEFTYAGDDGSNITVGETKVTVGEFTLSGDADEDVMLNAVVLKQAGTADKTEVVNYSLYYDDELIAGPVDMDGDDYIVFNLKNEMNIQQDEDYDFVIKADVEAGSGETVVLSLDETTDIDSTGDDNGFKANVTVAAGTADTYNIGGGALSIDEHKDNPAAKTYAPKTNDVLMLAAELNAEDETVVVTELPVTFTKGSGNIDTSDGNVELENVTVKLDGQVVCGPIDLDDTYTSSTAITVSCDEEFEVTGKQKLTVYADFTENAESTYTAKIQPTDLDSTGGSDISIENLDGDALYSTGTTYDVSGTAMGKTMAASAGTFSVSKDTKYTDRTITTGAKDYKIASFVVKAPTSQDVKVKKYIVTVGGNYGVANLSDLKVSEDTDVINDPSSSNTFNVSNLLAKEATKTVSVYASLDSSTTGTITTTMAVEWRGESNEVTATTNPATAGQTITVDSGALTVTEASTNPDADIVLSDAANTKVFVVEFDANYDTYTVTDMDITMSESSAVTSLKIGDKTVTDFVSGVAEFNGLNINVTDKTKVEVFATFNTVGDDGVDSGVTTTFALTGYEATATEGEDVVETSVSGVISNAFELRAAKPTLTYAAGGETASKGLLSTGENELIKVNIAADGGTVNLRGLTLEFNLSGLTPSDVTAVKLYDSSRTELFSTSTYTSTSTNSIDLTWTFGDGTDSDLEIGTSDYYYVGVEIGTVDDGDQIAAKVTNISWDDDEATSAITGTYVDTLPSAKYLATENS